MSRLRWSSPAREADPARVQREDGPVIVTSDSEEARKQQRARKKRKAAKALAAKKAKTLVVSKAAASNQHDRRRLQELEAKLAGLRRQQADLRAKIEPLTVRSVKKGPLFFLPNESVTALRKLRPVEADLAKQVVAALASYREVYRRVHGRDPPA